MTKRKILTVCIALLTAIFFNAVAFADDISDMQGEYDKTQQKIDDLKDQKQDITEEIEEDEKKVKTLESNIASINQDIVNMQIKINGVQKKINVTTDQLNAAIEEYNGQDERMKKRINALYKNGTSMGYIQVILEASSFSDFITRADIMKKIVDYDMNMLSDMKEKRDEIDKKKAELEQDKAELVALKANMDNSKGQLVTKKKEQDKMIALLSRKLSIVNSTLAQEEAAAKKILEEIARLSSKGIYDGSKYAIIRRSDFPSGKSPRITSSYGYRIDPITGRKGAYHSGVDIGTALLKDIPIYSMAPGRVVLAKWYGGYGNTVVIDHGSGFSTLYAHNNKLLVSVGQTVIGGQKIALSGSTGRSTGPHLHFGAMKNGNYVDPTPYLFIGN